MPIIKISIIKSCLFIFISVFIAACSPTGSNPTQVEISDLVGLWNSSEVNDAKKDVMYTRIHSNGGILEYDFDGDAVDQGLSCYQIDSGSIKHIESNRFLVTAEMHANKQYEVEMELLDNGYALKVYFLDSDDKDSDGDRAETLKSQIWTRERDESLLENEPSCK